MTQQQRLALFLLGGAIFMVTVDGRVITPLLPAIAADFQVNVAAAGLLVTAYSLAYGGFQLLYGPLGDRFGRERVLGYALVLFALGTGLSGLAPNLLFLDLFRFITGSAAAAVFPMSLAYIGDSFSYEGRQSAIGSLLSANALAQVLSFGIGGLMAAVWGWRSIFFVYALLSLPVAALLWRLPRAQQQRPAVSGLRGVLASYRMVVVRGAARRLYLVVCFEALLFTGPFSYTGAFLESRFGVDYATIGLLLSFTGVAVLIASRNVGALAARFGEARLILAGAFCLAIGFASAAVFPHWLLFPISVSFLGTGWVLCHSTLQTRATELAPEARGTGVSLFAFSFFTGGGIGAALFGALVVGAGYEVMLLSAALGLVPFALGASWLLRKPPERAAEKAEPLANSLSAP